MGRKRTARGQVEAGLKAHVLRGVQEHRAATREQRAGIDQQATGIARGGVTQNADRTRTAQAQHCAVGLCTLAINHALCIGANQVQVHRRLGHCATACGHPALCGQAGATGHFY